ncbi:MAG: xanthine dehydrogenase family protein molybdopterin-binding subunit [Thermoprotei archaeon]
MDDLFHKLSTGKGTFVDDIVFPDMLYLKVVRSPYARAKLQSVKGGLNHSDFQTYLASVGEGALGGQGKAPFPAFAEGAVNYVGQPVAAVYAEDRYKAEDLAESVEIEYDVLEPVLDPLESLKAPPIHAGLSSNVISTQTLGREFEAKSEIVLEDDFVMPRVAANPIETRGLVAKYEGGRLTVWVSTQSVHSVKRGLCESLHLPPGAVRVVQTDTGGAFGSKGGMYPEYAIACHLAMKTGQPVKWVESRSEHISASPHGRGAYGHVKLFAEKSGKVSGVEADIVVDGGAYYNGFNAFSPAFIALQITGPYAIANAYVKATSVYTNKPPLGPYRGAGRPEAAFMIERMLDRLADHLGADPLNIRLANSSSDPFISPTGLPIPASREFIERAAREMKYQEKAREKKARQGMGFSSFILVPATQPGEGARIAVRDGRVEVWLGGNSHGQRHDVFIRALISKELGVPEHLIDVRAGDTDGLEKGVGSWGSRTAIEGGAAIVEAARKLKAEARERVGSTGGSGYTADNLLRGEFDVTVFREEKKPLVSLGANLVVAQVDESGLVRVKECLSYYDVGRALNPAMVLAQIAGGAVQAIGQTLYEEVKYGADGSLLTYSIGDAGVPHSDQVPDFTSAYEEQPSDLPHGAKGVGESPTIGVPPALARAIEKAVGKRVLSVPVTPETLLT